MVSSVTLERSKLYVKRKTKLQSAADNDNDDVDSDDSTIQGNFTADKNL